MANPVLVEITRSSHVESVHRGAVAICDGSGRLVHALGDVEALIYPRSALKPVQALPLVESGAADALGLGTEEIALASASHSGEGMHTSRVAAWLKRIGCSAADLACGPHEIRHEPTRQKMRARGEAPTALHNNCSGKHTGFLTLARHLGAPTAGYVGIDHPVQRAVASALKDIAGLEGELPFGVDGCTAPNFLVSLTALARAMARLGAPEGLAPARAAAARRIVTAMREHPELIAGSGRVCSILIREAQGRAVVKTGAEGVYAAMLPERGLGIALKIDDGATRASEAAIAFLLIALGAVPRDGAAHAIAHAPIFDTRGNLVGERRGAAALASVAVLR
jgi:L-asparaginase II